MARFFYGNDFHINPSKYQALDNYCIREVNLKRDEVTNMYKSAFLAQDNYLVKKHLESEDSFLEEKLHEILRAKILTEIPVIDSEIGIRIKQPIEFYAGKVLIEIPKLMNIELGFINLFSKFFG